MGSSASAILANLVMEHVAERALVTAPHPPKGWHRYVDDSHVCIAREHLTEFHSHLSYRSVFSADTLTCLTQSSFRDSLLESRALSMINLILQ